MTRRLGTSGIARRGTPVITPAGSWIGTAPPPKQTNKTKHPVHPEPVNVTLFRIRVLAVVIKVRVSRWDHPGSRWDLSSITGILKRGGKKTHRCTEKKTTWKGQGLEWLGIYKPRNTRNCRQPLEPRREAFNRFSLRDSRGGTSPADTHFRSGPPELWDNISIVLSHWIWDDCHRSPRKVTQLWDIKRNKTSLELVEPLKIF